MLKDSRANGHSPSADTPADTQPGPHVVEDIEAAAESVPTADAASAALRSILIGAVLVGGLTWLARVVLQRQVKGRKRNSRG
jgi:hypothetical protein